MAIAIIPARGGSKGIPKKNIHPLHGKPLIAWTIEAALSSGCFAHVVVSTDCEEIASVARAFGAEVPFLRASSIATDESPVMPAVLDVLEHFEAETVVLLQPTSPLRTADDIRAALALHKTHGRPVVSVASAKPWLFTKGADGSLMPFTDTLKRRQEHPVVAPNGAIYIASRALITAGGSWWNEPLAYDMPAERSIDIDTNIDMMITEALFTIQPPNATDHRSVPPSSRRATQS